jgi:PAS domain S-box-containing protein
LGAITVRDVAQGREFTPAEIDLLTHLARLAAIGLENIRQRDELMQLFDNAAHAITVVNARGVVVKCNPQASALYGLHPDEVIGRPVTTLYEDASQAHLVQARLQRTPRRPLTDYDTSIRSANGEVIPIRLSAALLTDYMGNFRGSVGFFRDRRDIESIKQHSQQLTSLLEAIQGLTEQLDLDQLLTTIVQTARNVLDADAASVYLYDSRDDQISATPVQEGLRYAAQASEEVGEGSPARKLLHSEQIHFVDNVAHHEFLDGDFVRREKIVSLAAGPLKFQNVPVCVFFCNYREPHRFSIEEQKVFRLFATAAAVAIGKTRLYTDLQHKAWALEQLNQMALRITRAYQLPKLLQGILEAAVTLIAGQGGALYILEEHDRFARAAALLNMAPIRIPAGDNLVGQVCRTRKVKLISNYSKWPHRLQELDTYLLGDVAAVPIAYQDRTWGALVVHSRQGERSLQREDLPYLELLGQFAAVALENNRLQPLQRINIALALLSRWGHRARNKIYALGQEVKSLRKELPVGIPEYDDILENMETSLSELAYPAQILLQESDQVLKQGKVKLDLGRLMVAIAERVCSKSKQKITLEKEELNGELLTFAGSQLLVETAFELLIENAQTAIEQSGRPGTIKLKGAVDPNWIMLSIQDTGHGIPSEICNSFFQQPVASNTGFGYGSFVAANILRAQGGDILLVDTGPHGTRVELRLPRAWKNSRGEESNE